MKQKFFLCLALFIFSGTLLNAQVKKETINPTKVTKTPVKTNTKINADLLAKKIDLEDINEWLCPNKLLRGDREFGGNGPNIKCEVKLRIGDAGTALYADIYFWAQETKQDWSTTEGRWSKKVYDAPYGQKITALKSDAASRTSFTSPPAGFQFIFPGEDVNTAMEKFFAGSKIANTVLLMHGIVSPSTVTKEQIGKLIGTYSQGNTVVKVPATEGTLVKFFHIVGDTGGDDISTDDSCNDDTRIVKIEFFPVTVDMVKAKK